jgi:hypothetical protein
MQIGSDSALNEASHWPGNETTRRLQKHIRYCQRLCHRADGVSIALPWEHIPDALRRFIHPPQDALRFLGIPATWKHPGWTENKSVL